MKRTTLRLVSLLGGLMAVVVAGAAAADLSPHGVPEPSADHLDCGRVLAHINLLETTAVGGAADFQLRLAEASSGVLQPILAAEEAPAAAGADLPMADPQVSVEIHLPRDVPEVDDAIVRVRIEDVSRLDAPAQLVAEQVLQGIDLKPEKLLSIAVPVPGARLDPKAAYGVRVHISGAGGTTVKAGDLVSTQSHPVLTHGAPSTAVVPVRRVK